MKPVQFRGIITSLTAKVDGSLGMRLNTPELSFQEKALFFGLQNLNLDVIMTIEGEENIKPYTIDKDIERLTPSQRLRRTLYVHWQQLGSQGIFDDFYRVQMDKIRGTITKKLA